MPPGNSQKGKKGAASAMARQRSRNTTPSLPTTSSTTTTTTTSSASPSLPPIETVETEYLDLKLELFRNITIEDLVDAGVSNTVIPDSRSLDAIVARLQQLQDVVERRGNFCDRGMRLLAANRRTRMDEMAAERGREEERLRREAEDEERERRANKKKRKATENLAPQDSNIERSSPLRDPNGKSRKQSRDNDSTSSSLSPVAPATPGAMDVDEKKKTEENDSDDSSSDDGAPPPRPVPQNQTFGEDPSTFPDPTVYEIRDVEPDMTEDDIRKIYSVATYPRSDLANMIAGIAADKDYSSAKPSNQISFSTFSTYTEPYFRPYTEEDLGFLRERGDRVMPFVMPKRGKKHYAEVWAEEDVGMSIDSSTRDKVPPNQARGNIENMTDDIGETDKLSVGPLLSRLLQALRPESRAPSEDKPLPNGVNGDTSLNGGDITMNGTDPFTDPPTAPAVNGTAPPPTTDDKSLPPAAYMPESTTEAWKKASHPKLDYSQVDERIKQELRHIGILPLPDPSNPVPSATDAQADYDGAFDDEVAARLRYLQQSLREQMLLNGARKARLTELVKERMAHQEYQTILEDLDSQVQAAYLKRTRTMGKSKKGKRPGGAGGGSHVVAGGAAGMARPGIGDMTRTLMERRKRWIENIGTVFDDETLRVPRVEDEGSSIFRAGEMGGLIKREKEAWDEEVDEE